MPRAFIFVLDSVGIGGAPDAADYGDDGADTLGHIAEACASGSVPRTGGHGPLRLPNLVALGLGEAARLATGRVLPGLERTEPPSGFFGAASETSRGKDTPSGHWEIAGLPVDFDWGYFPHTVPTFPAGLTRDLVEQCGLPGILGNRHASGTEIIDELGEEHIRTGMPICYTSTDSVLQVAAHEERFGLARLYAVCETARRLVDPLNIGRVIARPFVGESRASFQRTANRRDYAVPPHAPTLLDRLVSAGRHVTGVGKIGDIFAHRGVSETRKASGNMAMFDAALGAVRDCRDGDMVFANFVDFDQLYGHRRDVAGYAEALEAFDTRLPEALGMLVPGDLLILTADHGCDPTWTGTDHTRERVPVIGAGPGLAARSIGLRATFADIGETVVAHLGIEPGPHGRSFRSEIADA